MSVITAFISHLREQLTGSGHPAARPPTYRWKGYLVMLALMAWFSIDPLLDADAWSPVQWMTVAIHESGHFVTRFWAPEFVCVAAGTGFQWGIPVLCGWLLLRQGEVFGLPVALVWLGLSLGMSVHYIADARAQALPLITVGEYRPTIHDWNYLLDHLGLLSADGFLAGVCRVASVLVLLSGLAVGVWMVWVMREASRPPPDLPK